MQHAAIILKYLSLITAFVSLLLITVKFIKDFFYKDKTAENVGGQESGKKYTSALEVFKYITPIFILNRLIVFVITYYSYVIPDRKKVTFLIAFKEIWYKWDSPHYVSIAQNWYQNTGEERLFIVFYPLYPALMGLVNIVISDYFISGILVSNAAFVIGIYYLYRLVELETNDREQTMNTVKLSLIFPFSFFFSIVYTESLFLALCTMTFYYMRKKYWLGAGICGMLAALTRNQGLLLALPLFIEILYENDILKYYKEKNYKSLFSSIFRYVLSLLLIPYGTFLYLLINKKVTGDWFRFLVYQKEHWHQSFGFFAENLKGHFLNIYQMEVNTAVGIWIPQFLLFFLCFGLIIYSSNKMRVSYTAFSFVYILVSYSPSWLLSGPRYVTGMFTLYMMLGLIEHRIKWLKYSIDFILIILLCFYSIQFSLWNVL